MQVKVKIGEIEVVVNDENNESGMVRYKEYTARLQEIITLITKEAIDLHSQAMGDDLK